jgi:hypothetical protein
LGIIGQLDAGDLIVDTRMLYTLTWRGSVCNYTFQNLSGSLLLQELLRDALTRLLLVPNTLKLLPFILSASRVIWITNNKVTLNWTVADKWDREQFWSRKKF